jgi:hypothetical protein
VYLIAQRISEGKETSSIFEDCDSKVTCHSKEIPYDAIFSDLVNSNEIDDGDECVTVDEPLCESLVNLVKFDENYSSHEEWSNFVA